MKKVFSLALVAMMVAGASTAMARNKYDRYWTDMSKPCGGYSCNSQKGSRAFWDYMGEHGK